MTKIRTSETDPLRIAQLPVGAGLVGVTLCPGKQGHSVFGAGWARDLAANIAGTRHFVGGVTQQADGKYRVMSPNGYLWDQGYLWNQGYLWTQDQEVGHRLSTTNRRRRQQHGGDVDQQLGGAGVARSGGPRVALLLKHADPPDIVERLELGVMQPRQ